MQRKRDGLVPIAEAFGRSARPGPGAPRLFAPGAPPLHPLPIRWTAWSRPAKRTPTGASWRGRWRCAACPAPTPGNRSKYVRRNGPYTLGMTAGINTKLPFGNLPRLILAWVCTEAVRTQSRVLVLGKSLSDFMRALGVYSSSGGRGGVQTRLRQSNEAAVRLHRDDDLRGTGGLCAGEFVGCRQARVLVERAQTRPANALGKQDRVGRKVL